MERWCERHEQVIDDLEGHEECHRDGDVLEPAEPDFEAIWAGRMETRWGHVRDRLEAMGVER